jgi:hypothetical protein
MHQRCVVDWGKDGISNVDNFEDRLTVELQKLQATEGTEKVAHKEDGNEKIMGTAAADDPDMEANGMLTLPGSSFSSIIQDMPLSVGVIIVSLCRANDLGS